MGLRVVSFGGGVQSCAMGVLIAKGKIPPVDALLFANVGEDSATIAYVRDVFTPWAVDHGLTVSELHKLARDGSRAPTLYQRLLEGCTHRSCANCPRWALRWRENALRRLAVQQPQLWEATVAS